MGPNTPQQALTGGPDPHATWAFCVQTPCQVSGSRTGPDPTRPAKITDPGVKPQVYVYDTEPQILRSSLISRLPKVSFEVCLSYHPRK